MARRAPGDLTEAWVSQSEDWRHPAQVVGHMKDATAIEASLLRHRARGAWWDTISALGVTLLVTREYEHLVLALSTAEGRPVVSFLPLPHPSGLAVDRERGTVFVGSTRNPNQVFDLAPVTARLDRGDVSTPGAVGEPILTVTRSRFYPGALYLHDLAVIGGELFANSVGQNAVVRLDDSGGFDISWWPKAIDAPHGPRFEANHLQLNSIASGRDLAASYFTASAASIGRYRPGHERFPVDGKGVIFSGATRDVVARGLTRPHSARILREQVWVDNSGYGEVGRIDDGMYEPVWRLPGWTRGLCFVEDVAFVGTSRVIPRFRQYAPGLDVDHSVCAIHALDMRSGKVLGSLTWPSGNQVFAIDWLDSRWTRRLPFTRAGHAASKSETNFFYTFLPPRGAPPNQKDS